MSHDKEHKEHNEHNGHEEEKYNFFETMTYPDGTALFAVTWTILAITFITLIVWLG
jgi:hypothetical protein